MSSKVNEVLKARQDFEYFATNDNFVDQDEFHPEKGLVLKDYHKEWLDALEDNRKVAITAFTGSGKTSVPGVLYPLWRAFCEPGFEVLVVSATMQQATEILKKIKHHINQSEYLSDLKPEGRELTWNQTSAELTNGSEIHCKPLSDKVKGTHADLAICDEAAEYEDHEFFQRYVRTRVESQGGTVCLISTPVHENDLMAKVSEGTMDRECPECGMAVDKKDEDYICMNKTCDNYGERVEPFFDPKVSEKGYWSETYPVWREVESLDAHEEAFEVEGKTVIPTFPENFDERSIRDLRSEDMTMFQKEYLCEPLAVEGDLFEPNDIIELYDKSEEFRKNADPNCEYYMGCDFAVSRQGDYSVYTIVEVPPDEKPVIRYMQRLQGVDLASQEERIKNLHDIFNFRDIIIDESNFGVRTKRELIQAGLPITGQSFESKARNGLLIGLKTSIEKGEFRIPRGSERAKQKTDILYNELLGFGTSETDTGKETYKSTAKHDDTVMSLAMVINNIDESREVDAMIAY